MVYMYSIENTQNYKYIVMKKILILILLFSSQLIQSQNIDSVTLILKNNQKQGYILNPFVNIIEYENIISSNKDTLIFKTSYSLDDTIHYNNETLIYNFRKKIKPKECVKKTLYITPPTFICKIIKLEISDRDIEYIYYFKHKNGKEYIFYTIETKKNIIE